MAVNYEAEESDRRAKRFFAQLLALGLFCAGVFLLLARLNGLAGLPGFLSNRAGLLADINLVLEMLLVAGIWWGVGWARRGAIYAHQYLLTAAVAFNLLLVLFVMAPALGSQVGWSWTILLHAVPGTLALLSGVYLCLRMQRLIPRSWRVQNWRRLMRVTVGLYTLAGLIGLGTYLFRPPLQ